MNTDSSNTVASENVGGAKMHKFFAYSRNADSEARLLDAAKSYKFFGTAEEARRHFQQEPRCAAGDFYESGWGALSLQHGMPDRRHIQVTALRRGLK